MDNTTKEKINYNSLIETAISEPGQLSNCFTLFHNYSLLNTMYIMRQLRKKHLPIEPIKGYKAWNSLNRRVNSNLLTNKNKYGFENGIEVLYPVFQYYPMKDENGEVKKDSKGKVIFRKYVKTYNYYKWHFSFSQTEVIDKTKVTETVTENKFHIDINKLCKDFEITIIPYNRIKGNCQGYAYSGLKEFALNPVCSDIVETAIHEIAHILLKHHETKYTQSIVEAEAELVTYIVLSICNNKVDLASTRAYIQGWLKHTKIKNSSELVGSETVENTFTELNSQRIIKVAGDILDTLKHKKD